MVFLYKNKISMIIITLLFITECIYCLSDPNYNENTSRSCNRITLCETSLNTVNHLPKMKEKRKI